MKLEVEVGYLQSIVHVYYDHQKHFIHFKKTCKLLKLLISKEYMKAIEYSPLVYVSLCQFEQLGQHLHVVVALKVLVASIYSNLTTMAANDSTLIKCITVDDTLMDI